MKSTWIAMTAVVLAAALCLCGCRKEPVAVTPDTPDTQTGPAGFGEPIPSEETLKPYGTVTLDAVSLRVFVWDDAHLLFVCANPDADGNLTQITLHLFDNRSGRIAASCGYPEDHGPDLFCYTDAADAMTLYGGESAYSLTFSDGALTLREGTAPADAAAGSTRVLSPDGRTVAYRNTDVTSGAGAVRLSQNGGASRVILTDVPYTEGLSQTRIYSPVGFLDATHLAYAIGGWDGAVGYGVYDTASGEKTEIENGMRLDGVWGGALYLSQMQSYRVTALYRAETTGSMSVLASEQINTEAALSALFGENVGVSFVGGKWVAINYMAGTISVYSGDLSKTELAAEPLPPRLFHIAVTDGGGLVLVD